MYEQWDHSNRIVKVNGSVRPPIVLRNEAEMFIAQNAHNLVWYNHWDECTALDKEIVDLGRTGADRSKPRGQLQAVFEVVKREIDALIEAEIALYRKEQANKRPALCIEDRIERLERKIEDLRSEIDDSAPDSDDALALATEALERAEEAYEKAEEAFELLQS